MKLLPNILLISMTFAIFYLFPACTKKIDPKSACGKLLHCPITKLISKATLPGKNSLDSITWETNFTYNAAGNPVGVYSNNEVPTWYYFWYDRQNRLTNYQYTYTAGVSAEVWHHYTYLKNGNIVDSEFNYVDTPLNASYPPAADFAGKVTTYHLDSKGRVYKASYVLYNGLPRSALTATIPMAT